jgi:DNA polymerase III subunit epsilon
MIDQDFEATAAAMEASGRYRVLHRLEMQKVPSVAEPGTRIGMFIDLETTGLDPGSDEIIEIAMIPFFYTTDGVVRGIGEPFNQLRQPTVPIPREVTALTGIDDAMVKGKAIDPEEVAQFAAPAALIVAHNAGFDRRFMERFCDAFSKKPWACSMSEIEWQAEGFEGTKLAYLAMANGFFYERHRAVHDCAAAIELLTHPLPRSCVNGLQRLLASARAPSWRIWAERAPYDIKDVLKARGYRWNGEDNGQPRSWWIDVQDSQKEAEIAFLCQEIYHREMPVSSRRLTAYNRFSDRIWDEI